MCQCDEKRAARKDKGLLRQKLRSPPFYGRVNERNRGGIPRFAVRDQLKQRHCPAGVPGDRRCDRIGCFFRGLNGWIDVSRPLEFGLDLREWGDPSPRGGSFQNDGPFFGPSCRVFFLCIVWAIFFGILPLGVPEPSGDVGFPVARAVDAVCRSRAARAGAGDPCFTASFSAPNPAGGRIKAAFFKGGSPGQRRSGAIARLVEKKSRIN